MKNLKKSLALLLVVSTLFAFSGCLKYTSNILEFTVENTEEEPGSKLPESTTITGTVPTTAPIEQTSGMEVTSEMPATESTTQAPTTEAPSSSAPVTEAPTTQAPTTEAPAADPTTFTKAQLMAYLTNAVNTTKAYTGKVSVHHKETISFKITECTGGKTVMNIIQPIVDKLTAPNEETLNFSGGKATTSEGEVIPILLPKRKAFSLSDAAVKSITATKSGSNTIVTLVLNSETGTKDSVPPFNAGCAGYLDISNIDLPSIIKIKEFNATYTGTKTVYTINDKGIVTRAEYTIPLKITGSGSAGLTANVAAEGTESELWEFNW